MMDTNNTLLEVQGLAVRFKIGKKKTLTAIQDVSFRVERGKTLGIVGESGCGKSVTANTILRLLPEYNSEIAAGSVLFDGQDLVKLSKKEMRGIRGKQISMIFQEPMTSLNPVYTIEKQMAEMLHYNTDLSAKEIYEESLRMLEKVGIPAPEQRIKEYPHQMSGGMRQRVMIAMALSTKPKLLIADEPTTALDVTIQAQVLDLMKKLQREMGTAILLITHDMGVIADTADYVLVMYGGEVMEYADVRTIFLDRRHPYTDGLLSSIPRLDQDVERLHSIDGVVPPLSDMPAGCRFCTRCPYATERCRTDKPMLTDLGGGHLVRCFKAQEEGKQ